MQDEVSPGEPSAGRAGRSPEDGMAGLDRPQQTFRRDPGAARTVGALGWVSALLAAVAIAGIALRSNILTRMLAGLIPFFSTVAWMHLRLLARTPREVEIDPVGIRVRGGPGLESLLWGEIEGLQFEGSLWTPTLRMSLAAPSRGASLVLETWYRDIEGLLGSLLRAAPLLEERAAGYSGETASWIDPFQPVLRAAALLAAGAVLMGLVLGDLEMCLLYAGLAAMTLVVPGLLVVVALPAHVREVRIGADAIELLHFFGRAVRIPTGDIRGISIETWVPRQGLRMPYLVLSVTRKDGHKVLLSSGVCRNFGACCHRVRQLWQQSVMGYEPDARGV